MPSHPALRSSLIDRLRTVERVVVLTGAGMSAESGIPTFREAQTGLWARFRPEELATPQAFAANPQRVWQWYQWRRQRVLNARPHHGHEALVTLEDALSDFTIITQNVDELHQRAGNRQVIELHGSILRNICSVTGRLIDSDIHTETVTPPSSPHHPAGLARPGVVWFGEALPESALRQAMDAVASCQVCISVGTSTLVQPAASLPWQALEVGATVVEINPEETPLSRDADFSLRMTASEGLGVIVRGCCP